MPEPLLYLLFRDVFTHSRQRQIRPKRLVSQGPGLPPGIQERAQCFPVRDVDQEPADPDADLALAWTGQRDDELDWMS